MFKEITLLNIQIARHELSLLDSSLAKAHAVIPVSEWRQRARGFAGIIRLILEQQVSVASANAIWGRLEAGLGIVDAQHILAKTVDELWGYYSAIKNNIIPMPHGVPALIKLPSAAAKNK